MIGIMAAWDTLSIAQRSQLMNIYRGYGITSLSDMRRMYNESHPQLETSDAPIAPMYRNGGNLYYTGGDKEGDTTKMTEDEYISKKIQEKIAEALERSRTRTEPAVPIVHEYRDNNAIAEDYRSLADWRLSNADKYATPLAKYGEDGIIRNPDIGVVRNAADRADYDYLVKQARENTATADSLASVGNQWVDVPGPTCIYTATDNYGPSHRVSGNQTFVSNPERFGFIQIPMEEVEAGDIVQAKLPGIAPFHGMVYNGQDESGNMRFNYSSGGISPESIVKNGKWEVDFLKEEDPDEYGNAFRFVGTPADSLRWKQEYNALQHKNGGRLLKGGGGDKNGQITASRVTAKRPVDFVDFSPESQGIINDWALAVRQGTVKFNQVPSKYQTAVYQRMITQSTDKAADTIAKIGVNTALAMSDPVGYIAGAAAQKGMAYLNDRISGRNEYTEKDILGYTPVRGTQYAKEHPVQSALTDVATGLAGSAVIRNVGNIARNANQAAQNAAGTSGLEREVLTYPTSQSQRFGTAFKSGNKGFGKTGTVRSAKGNYGYTPNTSLKGVYSNQSSSTPILNTVTPDATIPITPIPTSSPSTPVWWNRGEPQTIFISPQIQPETPAVRPPLTSYGNSRTPQEVIEEINRYNTERKYYIGGDKKKQQNTTQTYAKPASAGDDDFVGPIPPLSVMIAKSERDKAYERAKDYEQDYPNIAYFLKKSGELRGQRLGANEAMIMGYEPQNLIYLKGTKDHNVPVTSAVLDSIGLNGARTGISPIEALGLPAQETNFGYYPTAAWVGEEMRSFAREMPGGYAANRWQITPIEFLNDASYANEPYGNSISYVAKKLGVAVPVDDATKTFAEGLPDEQLSRLETELAKGRGYADSQAKKLGTPGSIFRHAYETYKSGNYNSGDLDCVNKVINAGQDAWASPQIQQWWNTSGRKYYEQYAPELLNGLAEGGPIHIKPSRRGTFTAAATKHGMGVQEFASKVLANKDDYSPKW